LSVNNEKKIGYTVNVELFGLPADSFRGQKSHRVKAVPGTGNSFFVNYADSDIGFMFKKIIMPQLALIHLTVLDEQNKLVGRRCLPVVGLRPGYRFVNLKNESNQPLNMCCLFVYIKHTDYVPEELEEFANALVNPIEYVKSVDKKEEMLKRLQDENDDKNDELPDEDLFYSLSYASSNTNKEISTNNIDLDILDSPITQQNDLLYTPKKLNKIEPLLAISDNLLESIDINSSELNNNDDILREINFNYLKTSESYLKFSQKYTNRIDRIEKDTEKKIYDLDQSLTMEIDRISKSKTDSKSSRFKELAKKTIFYPFSKNVYSPSFVSPSSSNSNLNFDNTEVNIILNTCRQKYIKQMMITYIECFQEIYKLKIESIEPVSIKTFNINVTVTIS